jgi:hypothetical protein
MSNLISRSCHVCPGSKGLEPPNSSSITDCMFKILKEC